MQSNMHHIVKTKEVRHSDLVGCTVTFICSCGVKVRSRSGTYGAHRAFDKHINRRTK